MELTPRQVLDYIESEDEKHRATLDRLKKDGKTYRSRDVAHENGYLNALRDIKAVIEQPAKNEALHQAMKRFGEALKEEG